MSDQPRDWDKELAAIDRAMERMPQQQPAPAALPQGGVPSPSGPVVTAPPAPARGSLVRAWFPVLLVAVLGAAMPFWPYGHGCGFGLAAYFVGAGMVVAGGIWASVSTWQHRRGIAHGVALLTTLWGLVLVTAQILPRVGYAKQIVHWTCG